MRKTLNRGKEQNEYLTVNADTLAAMLDCGRATATKIGLDAGARIQIGRRTLYKVSIIDKLLFVSLSEPKPPVFLQIK